MDCVMCHQPAELEFEGVPVCKDCFSLQGSTCSGPLYRLVQEKRKKDRELKDLETRLPIAGAGVVDQAGASSGSGKLAYPGKPAKPDTPDTL